MFTVYNTTYSDRKCQELNKEFEILFDAGEWSGYGHDGLSRDEAEKEFSDDVSRR